jgi:Uma2 family endonuclease
MNDMALDYARHRFTVEEYHRMDDARVFSPDAHIELIDGEVVERLVSMKPPHAAVVELLYARLSAIVGDRALVRYQLPITLGDFSEPEPDFAIVCGSRSLFRTRHPGPGDIESLIEVADRSRDFDVRRKVPIYASFRIPETWVVDLVDSCVHVFRDPDSRRYRDSAIAQANEQVALLAFPEVTIRVGDLFE